MLTHHNAKCLEHLNVTEAEGFVIGAIEGYLDNGSGGPGINSTLNLFCFSAVD